MSSEAFDVILLSSMDSSFEIEDCIRLNRVIISSWLDELGFPETEDFVFSSLFVSLPEVEFLCGARPLLIPSDPMHEMVNKRSFRVEAKDTSAISPKFNKLHKNGPSGCS